MINTGMNNDKLVNQSQQSVTPTQKPTHGSGIRLILKKAERELEELNAKQYLQQQNNIDLNNTNVEVHDTQGIVGQRTILQPLSDYRKPKLKSMAKTNGSLINISQQQGKNRILNK
ncbi:MAG: hypothetical protein EZS28_004708 [Streblomastix strix]|uniref:Uncharacterized protein n=1 Tax=Streblomastix strix TaxID=222440 RepID=A0A5J4WZY2_9EUKA|nr:MAG: hypothetical protein EZS28_004708 [Streblomastix strix]